MTLSYDVISDFVKLINRKPEKKQEATLYGSVAVVQPDRIYVRLDGSPDGVLTPVVSSASVANGNRVTVVIRDHTAVITGNLTDPSASTFAVTELSSETIGTKSTLVKKGAIISEINSGSSLTKISASKLDLSGCVQKVSIMSEDGNYILGSKIKDSSILPSKLDMVSLSDELRDDYGFLNTNDVSNYVVFDETVENGWRVRKWNNRFCEMWYRYSSESIDCTAPYGNMYTSAVKIAIPNPNNALPATEMFVDLKYFSSFHSDGVGFASLVEGRDTFSNLLYQVVSPLNGSVTNCALDIYVAGTLTS